MFSVKIGDNLIGTMQHFCWLAALFFTYAVILAYEKSGIGRFHRHSSSKLSNNNSKASSK